MSGVFEFTGEKWEEEIKKLFLPEILETTLFLILFNFFQGFQDPVYISCNQVAREVGKELKIDGVVYNVKCEEGEISLEKREESS